MVVENNAAVIALKNGVAPNHSAGGAGERTLKVDAHRAQPDCVVDQANILSHGGVDHHPTPIKGGECRYRAFNHIAFQQNVQCPVVHEYRPCKRSSFCADGHVPDAMVVSIAEPYGKIRGARSCRKPNNCIGRITGSGFKRDGIGG